MPLHWPTSSQKLLSTYVQSIILEDDSKMTDYSNITNISSFLCTSVFCFVFFRYNYCFYPMCS